MKLTHLSLFSGIGGMDLAAEWAGFKTILFVEIDSYCQKVLRKHWPDVPIIGDIKDVTKERIQEAIANASSQQPHNQKNEQEVERKGGNQLYPEQSRDTEAMADTKGKPSNGIKDNARNSQRPQEISKLGDSSGKRNGEGNRTISPVTLITGGFPCQPVSAAGKRRGKADDRWLWPEMLRVISEVRPTWVVAENVAGLLNMGFNDCVSDLESEGYETIPFLIPACAVNAPHRRDRIFIVGYSEHARWNDGKITGGFSKGGNLRNGKEGQVATRQLARPDSSGGGAGDVANAKKCNRDEYEADRGDDSTEAQEILRDRSVISRGQSWWAVESELGRVADGIPSRVDRLKCLGNAVVPHQIYPILKGIADFELASKDLL